MDKDFSELIEYLDKKFSGVDEKFSAIDEKFFGIDEKFSGIDRKFSSIDGKLVDLDAKIEELMESKADKSDINELMGAIDAYAKKADAYFQEMVMLAHKVDRLEKWIQQIAEKVGMRLDY